MDISDINKVATTKRLNIDAEKLREKVSRESTKIIKLKVAQDTAYWDLKEKLQQVEGNHERLQQNMVEVQMQHEAISGQYQEELRLRPETLNKMSSTREICDVLEEYSERLKETLTRCKSDQGALCEAYQRSGLLVRDLKLQQARLNDENQRKIEKLEEKAKLTSDHHSQLIQYLSAAKQQADAEIAEARSRLSAAEAQRDELVAATAELRAQADIKQVHLQKKEESILSLQNDMKQLLHEFNHQANELKDAMVKKEKDLKEALESNEVLKKALNNQEEFTKSVCTQNEQLNEKIADLQEHKVAAATSIQDLETKLQNASVEIESLKKNIELQQIQKEEFENIIIGRSELLANTEKEVLNLNQQLSSLGVEKTQLAEELIKAKEECDVNSTHIKELEISKAELEKRFADLTAEMAKQRDTSEGAINELTSCIQLKDKELNDRAHTIGQLMTDVKTVSDARAKVDITLQRVRKEADAEKEVWKDKEWKMTKQIEQLEINVRDKDDELSKQMSIILEIRSEKERLHEKIESMQNKIDNIQKELTGPPRARVPPDHDDNALMCPPAPPAKLQAPQREEARQLDSMLFSMFSDTSMDGDTLDAGEVNRRFEALSRGERMSPVPIKRRAGAGMVRGGLAYKAQGQDDCDISLSQVKNDLRSKEKGFFKNKRIENKAKKLK